MPNARNLTEEHLQEHYASAGCMFKNRDLAIKEIRRRGYFMRNGNYVDKQGRVARLCKVNFQAADMSFSMKPRKLEVMWLASFGGKVVSAKRLKLTTPSKQIS